jgi:hypothetical protein
VYNSNCSPAPKRYSPISRCASRRLYDCGRRARSPCGYTLRGCRPSSPSRWRPCGSPCGSPRWASPFY